jgi:hypothetical protein
MPESRTPAFRALNRIFLNHIRSFGETDDRVKAHFDLKIRHTYQVVRNIQEIAEMEGLGGQTVQRAKIIALLHDIGRFKQFMDYGTFDDSISLNHAELSVRLLHDEGIDRLIPVEEMNLIARSILQHNLPRITETNDNEVILYSRLLRDADKMDIWKLQTETDVVFTIRSFEMVDHYEIPDAIYQCFLSGHILTIDRASSLNDFRLLRLSWIFDMNFPSTFVLLIKKDFATILLSKIPASEKLDEIAYMIHQYMHQRAQR